MAGLVLAGTATVYALWLAATGEAPFCPIPEALLPGDAKNSQPSCLEFWVNRYQTLIGAAAAIAAAWIAWQGVTRQVLVAQDQLGTMKREAEAAEQGRKVELSAIVSARLQEIQAALVALSEGNSAYRALDVSLRMGPTANLNSFIKDIGPVADFERCVAEINQDIATLERIYTPGTMGPACIIAVEEVCDRFRTFRSVVEEIASLVDFAQHRRSTPERLKILAQSLDEAINDLGRQKLIAARVLRGHRVRLRDLLKDLDPIPDP